MQQLTGTRAAAYAEMLTLRRSRLIDADTFRDVKTSLQRQQASVDKRIATLQAKRAAAREAKRLNTPVFLDVLITAKAQWADAKYTQRFTRTRTVSIQTTIGKQEQDVKRTAEAEVQQWETDSKIEITSYKVRILAKHKTKPTNTQIQNVPMKRAGALALDGEEAYEFDQGEGTCVFDFLEWRYGQLPRAKKIAKRANLIKIFGEEALETGVSAEMMKKFADAIGVRMYALDETNNVFMHYVPTELLKGDNLPPLCFRVKNGHFYPIIKEAARVAKIVAATAVGQAKAKKEEVAEEKEIISEVEAVKTTDPLAYLVQTCKAVGAEVYSRTKPKLSFNDDGLCGFTLAGKKYLMEDCDMVNQAMEIAKLNDEEYTGQTVHGYMAKIAAAEKYDRTSVLNPDVAQYFTDKKAKFRTHLGMVAPMTKNAWACDIAKCYTSCITEPMAEWIVYDIHSDWQPFEWRHELRPGFYTVSTKDMTLLHGDNIYSHTILNKAREEGIRFDCYSQLLAAKTLPRAYFHRLLERVEELCKGDARLKKTLVNLFIGTLGRSTHKNITARMDTDANTVWRAFKTETDGNFFVHKREEYYIYGRCTQVSMSENNLPIHFQILDQANIRLYDMIKATGGKLLGRKVDCAILSGGAVEMDKSVVPGSYRSSPVPKGMKSMMSAADRSMTFPDALEWDDASHITSSNQIEEAVELLKKEGGLLINGRAGTGKSFLLNGIAKHFENVVKMAFTNKAALNIGGQTIHKFLKIDAAGKAALWALKRKYRGRKALICVDEISMINGHLWRMLAEVKKILPDAMFVLCGDYRQLPAIEEVQVDWFQSSVVKHLACGARVDLCERQRYDEELWNASEDVNTSKWQKGAQWEGRHLCYFNATRKRINARLNQKRGLFVEYNGDKADAQQNAYLYPALPVIARINYSTKEGMVLINSEQFVVESCDVKQTTVVSQRPDGEHRWTFETCKFHDFFLMNFATTVHRAQGDTMEGDITVWDWDAMSVEMRYTAATRARKFAQVFVA